MINLSLQVNYAENLGIALNYPSITAYTDFYKINYSSIPDRLHAIGENQNYSTDYIIKFKWGLWFQTEYNNGVPATSGDRVGWDIRIGTFSFSFLEYDADLTVTNNLDSNSVSHQNYWAFPVATMADEFEFKLHTDNLNSGTFSSGLAKIRVYLYRWGRGKEVVPMYLELDYNRILMEDTDFSF